MLRQLIDKNGKTYLTLNILPGHFHLYWTKKHPEFAKFYDIFAQLLLYYTLWIWLERPDLVAILFL